VNRSSNPKRDSTQHPHSGGDPRRRDQSRPDAAVRRAGHGADRQRAGMRISEFRGAEDRDAHHAQQPARRRQRNRNGRELSAAGKRWTIFPDWRVPLYARECLGNRKCSGRLEGRGAGQSFSGPRDCYTGERLETNGAEKGGVAVQHVLRKRRSSSRAQVGSSGLTLILIHAAKTRGLVLS